MAAAVLLASENASAQIAIAGHRGHSSHSGSSDVHRESKYSAISTQAYDFHRNAKKWIMGQVKDHHDVRAAKSELDAVKREREEVNAAYSKERRAHQNNRSRLIEEERELKKEHHLLKRRSEGNAGMWGTREEHEKTKKQALGYLKLLESIEPKLSSLTGCKTKHKALGATEYKKHHSY